MRGSASVLAAVALGSVLCVAFTYRASLAHGEAPGGVASSQPQSDLYLAGFQAEPDDRAQRQALNARLQTMISEGKGARLDDEPFRTMGQRVWPNVETSQARLGTTKYRAPELDLRTPPNIPLSPLDCLTQAIYYEARNESEAGQAAVAEVVMNRVRHAAYPNEVCAVVYQRNSRTCQFTFTCDGSIGRSAVRPQAWERAQRIARDVYEGRSANQLPPNSLNYHANYVRPSWGQRLDRVRQIGAHIFYGSPRGRDQTPGASPSLTAPLDTSRGTHFTQNTALNDAYARHVAQVNGADQT